MNIIKEEEATSIHIPQQHDHYEYQLVGVLIHSGSCDSGHYYSYIKERNKDSQNYGKWFEFNDTTVKEFSTLNLKRECFGGQQQKNDNGFGEVNQTKMQSMYERCCNAYLIIYERIDKVKVDEVHVPKDQKTKKEENRVQLFKTIFE